MNGRHSQGRSRGLLETLVRDVVAWFESDDPSGERGRDEPERQAPEGSETHYGGPPHRRHHHPYGARRGDYGGDWYAADPGFNRGQSRDFDYEREPDLVYGDRRVRDYGRGSPSQRTEREPEERGGRYAGVGPKGFRRSPERLRELVCERLTDAPGVDASEIEVHVEGDEVTLTGRVPSRAHKRAAEDCAEAVPGVRDVHNRLTLIQAEPRDPYSPGAASGRERKASPRPDEGSAGSESGFL